MLELTESNLSDLVTEAIRYRCQHTDHSQARIRKFAGNRYRTDWTAGGDAHENYGWEYCVNTLPGLFHQAPRIEIASDFKNTEMFGTIIRHTETAYNGWLEKSEAADTISRIVGDTMFDFGVGMTLLEAFPGQGDDPQNDQPQPLLPRLYRVSPRRFVIDPTASAPDQARFMGHIWCRDMDDLVNSKMFDPTALDAMAVDQPATDFLDPEAQGGGRPGGGSRSVRNRAWGMELFIPETRQILTLGITGSVRSDGLNVVILREPQQYYGHRHGPYRVFGMYWVPDQVLPIAPLAITEEEEDELNRHLGQISDDAGTAKQVIINTGSAKDGALITTAANGLVLNIPGAQKDMLFPLTFPGAQPANVEHVMLLRERLDRKGGLTEATRGRVDPDATATAEAAAAAGTSRRAAFQKKEFRKCCASLLERALYYFWESDQVTWDVPIKDPQTGQEIVQTLVGGPIPDMEALHLPFETLRLNIEPMTMEYEDDAIKQRRLAGFFEGMTNMIAFAKVEPSFKIENAIDDLAESFNIRGAGERYLDMNMFRQMQQMQLLMGMAQQGLAMQGQSAENQQKANQPASKPGDNGALNPVRERASMLAEAQRR